MNQNACNAKILSKPDGVVEIPENILPEFFVILLERRDNACNKNVTLGSLT